MLDLSHASILQFRQYVEGDLDLEGLYEWLLSAEYDESLSSHERNTLAQVRAVALDVADQRASEIELDNAIITLIQTLSGSELLGGASTDIGTGLNMSWFGVSWAMAETVEVDCQIAPPMKPPTPALVSTAVTREFEDQSGRILVGTPH